MMHAEGLGRSPCNRTLVTAHCDHLARVVSAAAAAAEILLADYPGRRRGSEVGGYGKPASEASWASGEGESPTTKKYDVW
jgi:hypothetical protein